MAPTEPVQTLGQSTLEKVWSPLGSKIVFASNRDGRDEIYVMNANGSQQTRLTNNLVWDNRPRWSPDREKIAFERSYPDDNYEIFVMNADGSGETRLTDNPDYDWYPVWSPDGNKITFTSSRDGNYEIYVMNADGSGQTRLTDNLAADGEADWDNRGHGN
jgi:TolB protein